MSRHVPLEFAKKVASVVAAVEAARQEPRRTFHVSLEVQPGVRLVVAEVKGTPIVFSLWIGETDVAEICGDAAYPATSGLLAIDKRQVADLGRAGIIVDLNMLVRSQTLPGMYYALFDCLSEQRLRTVIGKVVSALSGVV